MEEKGQVPDGPSDPSDSNGTSDPKDTNGPDSPDMAPSEDELYEAIHGYKPSESPEEAAKQILKDGLVAAAQQIVLLANAGTSERIRAECSKYVLEYNLGKPVGQTGLSDPWKELLKDLQKND